MHTMKLLPATASEILAFDRIRDLIAKSCIGVLARERCAAISPSTDVEWIATQLDTVNEAKAILDEGLRIPDGDYPPVARQLDDLRMPGFVLAGEDVLLILMVLQQTHVTWRFFDGARKKKYPHIASVTAGLEDTTDLIERIRQVLDEEGEIRPDASRRLLKLSRDLQSKRSQSDGIFQKIVQNYKAKGWLADSLESVRSGRRVLAVASEHKRKIKGIVHDQSATGKTTFVEPGDIIEINNEIVEIQAEYRAEQRKILAALSDDLRPHIDGIRRFQSILTDVDLSMAKARFAREIDAHRPELDNTPGLHVVNGIHPLLFLKNRQSGKPTIPFDLKLDGNNRILLLSGPNAGGKSILMKTVGLLQLMLQSGLLVSANPVSRFGVFDRLCVELGDQQSIENDLSTYSSRLMDMRDFVKHAGKGTLVLIDEFGAGTDPKVGGAIAEAILEALRKAGVHGVITTHYTELKVYAHKQPGVMNGAMIFDDKTMSPSYELRTGRPGSSFAFEIAEKTGLPPYILNYARKRAGKDQRALEDLLVDLESQKSELRRSLSSAREKEKNLDKLVSNYERMQTELTAQRKKMRLEQKERDYQHLSQLNKQLEREIRMLKEQQDLAKAREKLQVVKGARKTARSEIGKITEELDARARTQHKDLDVGDYVKLKNSEQTGKIERLEKKTATVIIGQVRMEVPVRNLMPAAEPVRVNPRESVRSHLQETGQFNPLLDIRGMRADDALQMLEKFLDQAMISGASMVRIIHGKGTGTLKRIVEDKLREYPVTEVHQPRDQHGGSGETVIQM